MKSRLGKLLEPLISDYRINWIYAASAASMLPLAAHEEMCEIDAELRTVIEHSSTEKVVKSLTYALDGFPGLAILRGGAPLCVAHFATLSLYGYQSTWPLKSGEIALVDIATEEAARGQGLAPRMIAAATRHYMSRDVQRMVAFIWWSNAPSVRAFRKAGWQRAGLSVEWETRKTWRKLHISL